MYMTCTVIKDGCALQESTLGVVDWRHSNMAECTTVVQRKPEVRKASLMLVQAISDAVSPLAA